MANRFDLEQHILNCWNVVDDLKQFGDNSEVIQAMEKLYQAKFEKLFECFEEVVRADQLHGKITYEKDTINDLIKVTRVEVIDENGRTYVNRDKQNFVQTAVQDNGQTLKVFVNKRNTLSLQDLVD